MSQEDVKKVYGEPDKIRDDEREKGTIVYTYNNELIKFLFGKYDNYKLSTIEVFNPKATLFNKNIINMTKEEIENFLKSNGYSEFEFTEYIFSEQIYCESICSFFEFEFNRLRSVEISLLSDNEGNDIWPKII